MAEDGEKKLIAVARHIAKTLGHTDTMTDDILHIFSNFDGRLREKLLQNLSDDDPRAMERTLDSLDRQISRYASADHPIWSDSDDASAFLDAVDEVISAIRNWTPMAGEMAVAACVDRAEDLLQQAMFQLEEEFRFLIERGGESFDLTLSRNGESAVDCSFDSEEGEDGGMIGCGGDQQMQIPVAKPVTDYDVVVDPMPPGTINDLHEIAKRMVAAGHGKECSHVYGSFRREFLEESSSRLGLEKMSIEEVQKIPWSDLEDEIERWIKVVKVSVRILFPSERRLCDRIFSSCCSVADLSFMEICRGPTIQLLNFAGAVAVGSRGRAPERLFKVLDVFETLGELMPEFDALFSDKHCLFLRNEAITVWKRLGEAIRGIFIQLENLIRQDPAKAVVPGGGLHPITRYVMNYLRAACRSRQTLEQVFDETIAPPDGRSFCPSLSVQMAWIMELLESNLESKSKVYRDSALCSVFLMNNGRYIVQKVKDTELGSLLGDDWIRKHNAMVRQHHLNYQRSSWRKVLGVLSQDSPSFKEKLKLFNHYFEDVCKNQTTWVIFDDQLREELRISVAGNLSPAYRNFLGSLQDSGKHEKHIKYSVEELEVRINQLFQGSGRK